MKGSTKARTDSWNVVLKIAKLTKTEGASDYWWKCKYHNIKDLR